MKKQLFSLAMIGLLAGCGDIAETAIQGAAEAVAKKNQTTPPQQPVVVEQAPQQVQQPLQPVAQPTQVQPAPQELTQQLPPKPAPVEPKFSEQIVRERASVLTQYGGKVLVRSQPNKNAKKLGFLYDQEAVWVIGITNRCETINKIEGCWVKVIDSVGLSGYSFDGYLQY